jgi:hypothetical protein
MDTTDVVRVRRDTTGDVPGMEESTDNSTSMAGVAGVEGAAAGAAVAAVVASVKADEIAPGVLHVEWGHSLDKCIDGSPLVIVTGGGANMCVVSTSHAGIVTALDVITSSNHHSNDVVETRYAVRWKVVLPGRVESSAVLHSDRRSVLVSCYDHSLYV